MSQPATAHPHLCLYLVKVCGLALLCLTSLCLPLPARAGQWTVSYSQGQTDSYLQFDYQHPATPTFIQHAWQPPPVSGADADAYWWYIGYRWYESENLDLAGSDAVLATITWQPDGGKTLLTDPPPAKLTLIETAHSWWGATWNGSGPPTAADGQASDGLGDPMVFTVSPNSSNGFGTSSGRHLIQVDGSSGVVKIPCILSAQNPTSAWVPSQYDPDYTTSYWSWSPNSIEYTFSVRPDSREVMISSPIEASYYKGPFDILRGTTQYTHQRDPATGAISVDSAVVWKNASQGGLGVAGVNKGWYADQIPLTANMSNFTNPFLSWTLLGMTSPDASLDIAINPVHFSLYEVDDVKFPLSSTVRADVTDSDGAVSANTYGMTWHLPFEKNQLISTSYTRKKHGASRVAEVYPGETKMRMPVPPEKIGLSAALDAGVAVTKGLGDEKDSALFEIAAKFAELAHLEYEFPGEEGDKDVSTGAANTPGSGNWGFARGDMDEKYAIVGGDSNIPDALKDDPANQALCKMSWWVVEKDKSESWYADGYNANGYDGNSQHVVTETHVEGMEDQAFFEQYKTPDGTLL